MSTLLRYTVSSPSGNSLLSFQIFHRAPKDFRNVNVVGSSSDELDPVRSTCYTYLVLQAKQYAHRQCLETTVLLKRVYLRASFCTNSRKSLAAAGITRLALYLRLVRSSHEKQCIHLEPCPLLPSTQRGIPLPVIPACLCHLVAVLRIGLHHLPHLKSGNNGEPIMLARLSSRTAKASVSTLA